MPRWRKPSRKQLQAREKFYTPWIADDVAQMLSYRLPMKNDAAKRLVQIMKARVLDKIADNPDELRQDMVDDVTTETIMEIELGEDVDWALLYLVSP